MITFEWKDTEYGYIQYGIRKYLKYSAFLSPQTRNTDLVIVKICYRKSIRGNFGTILRHSLLPTGISLCYDLILYFFLSLSYKDAIY